MKHFYLKALLISFLSAMTLNALAYDCVVDGIFYNLNTSDKTAEVTYKSYNSSTNSTAYTGKVVIPETVSYDGTTYHVTAIENYAFYKCSGLTAVTIPNSVTTIGESAFYGCGGLTAVRLPESVTNIEKDAFSVCSSLKELVILSPIARVVDYYGYGGNLYAYKNVLDNPNNRMRNCKKIEITNPYYAAVSKQSLSSVAFQVREIKHEHEQTECSLVRVEHEGKILAPDEEGNYILTGLSPNKTYSVLVVVLAGGEELKFTCTASTLTPSCSIGGTRRTQTGINIELCSWQYDENMKPVAMGVEFNGKIYETKSLGRYEGNSGYYGTVKISDLIPNTQYSFMSYIKYENGMKFYGNTGQFTTLGIYPTITNSMTFATSFSCDGSYTEGTAKFKNGKFTFNGTEYEGNSLLLTGLEPNTSYVVKYTATTEEGSKETSSDFVFKTTSLSLVTESPKCVSSTCAIVAATTNISGDETGVGFQWKKYDAPASLAPKEGYAAIHDGMLEGYVKNLQSTSYYNVRAFYKSTAGNYYYGSWVTFDPSDFSYFEPTVHTYAAEGVTESSAKVKGYALAGTNEIEEQGFEYWSMGESESNAKVMRAMPAAAPVANGFQTVFATGQIMTAELHDLEPSTTYCCRAFVTTSAGKTYGEEQTFITLGGETGIVSIATGGTAPEIEGYYDLNGRKLQQPQCGMNIIRYSDGSARKVFVK